jgi:hypothetical protein
VVGAIALLRADDDKQQVNIAGTTSTSTSTSTTATTTSTTAPAPFPTDAIWPSASMNVSYTSADEAARTFAVDYLGMTNARVGATDAAGVEIFGNARTTVRMLVQVRESAPHGFVVTGATSQDIVVDTPQPHDVLTSTLTLTGTSVAFEAQVGVELRRVGSRTPVANASVMGGSTELQPFEGSIDVPSTDRPLVLILFEGDASGEQTYTTATVLLLDAAA